MNIHLNTMSSLLGSLKSKVQVSGKNLYPVEWNECLSRYIIYKALTPSAQLSNAFALEYFNYEVR